MPSCGGITSSRADSEHLQVFAVAVDQESPVFSSYEKDGTAESRKGETTSCRN